MVSTLIAAIGWPPTSRATNIYARVFDDNFLKTVREVLNMLPTPGPTSPEVGEVLVRVVPAAVTLLEYFIPAAVVLCMLEVLHTRSARRRCVRWAAELAPLLREMVLPHRARSMPRRCVTCFHMNNYNIDGHFTLDGQWINHRDHLQVRLEDGGMEWEPDADEQWKMFQETNCCQQIFCWDCIRQLRCVRVVLELDDDTETYACVGCELLQRVTNHRDMFPGAFLQFDMDANRLVARCVLPELTLKPYRRIFQRDPGSTHILADNQLREFETTWSTYPVPSLRIVNQYRQQFLTNDGDQFLPAVLAFADGVRTVPLPTTYLNETSRYWAGKSGTYRDFLGAIAWTRNWASRLDMTDEQMRGLMMYGPFMSLIHHQPDMHSVNRIITGNYTTWWGLSCTLILLSAFYTVWTTLVPLEVEWHPRYWPVFTNRRWYELSKRWTFAPHVKWYDVDKHLYNSCARIVNHAKSMFAFTYRYIDCDYYPNWIPFTKCSYEYEVLVMFNMATILLILSATILLVHLALKCDVRVVFRAVTEEVAKLAVASWLYQYDPWLSIIPYVVVGLIESMIYGDITHLAFHAATFLIYDKPVLAILMHIMANCWLGERFNVVKAVRYLLTVNFSPEVHVRDKAGCVLPMLDSTDADKRQESQYLYGIGSGGYRPVAYSSCLENEIDAVRARILAPTQEPNYERLREMRKYCRATRQHWFGPRTNIREVDFAYYIKHSNAAPGVKRKYIEAKANLDEAGITTNTVLSKQQLRSWTSRKAFVKVENNVYRTPHGRKRKACRLIQGAKEEFICLVGPWIMAFQHVMKKRWGINSKLCYTSGVAADEAAVFISGDYDHILEDDMGAFDSSLEKELLLIELDLYKWLGAPPAVLQLLRYGIRTHGMTAHGVRYWRDAMRKSGDPNTSCGNTLINGLAHLFVYARNRPGWSTSKCFANFLMLAQGDDNLMRYNGPIIDWVSEMASLGLQSEAMHRATLLDAEFCSNLYYETPDGPTFGPKPGRVMSKLGYFINPPRVKPESLVRGTALGLKAACAHIPPLNSYLNRLLDLTQGHHAYYTKSDEWKMSYKPKRPLPYADPTLFRRYHWGDNEQRELESELATISLCQDLDGILSQMLYDRDTSGPRVYAAGAA